MNNCRILHNKYGPLLTLIRLRPAIYFFCITAITTIFYCLVFYEHDGLQTSTTLHKYPMVNRNTQLLDELMRNANRHFIDNFRRKINVVPLDDVGIIRYELNNDSSLLSTESEFEITLLDGGSQQLSGDMKKKFYDDDIEFDHDSIEYYLRHLGFDLQNIIRLGYSTGTNNRSMNMDSKSRHNKTSSNINQPNIYLNRSLLLPIEFIQSTTISKPLVFVTAFDSTQFQLGFDFIKSFESFKLFASQQMNNNIIFNLVVYDLGLYPNQFNEIELLCNSTGEFPLQSNTNNNLPTAMVSTTQLCQIRKFHFETYPSHVSELKTAAYRSIIIQELLRDLKRTINYYRLSLKRQHKKLSSQINLFWLDAHYRFINSRYSLISILQNSTLNTSGILSWPIEQPTSALTHPRMFEYFHITADNFFFHRMIRTGHLLISLNDSTWAQFQWGIMMPWVRCSLTVDCIAPLGSQWRSTCRLDKKPHYRYSGCHHYDMSALNVVLGIAFNFSSTIYSAHSNTRFFTPFYNIVPPEGNTSTDHIKKRTQLTIQQQQQQYPTQTDSWSRLDSYGRFDQLMNDDDIPPEWKRKLLPSSTIPEVYAHNTPID